MTVDVAFSLKSYHHQTRAAMAATSFLVLMFSPSATSAAIPVSSSLTVTPTSPISNFHASPKPSSTLILLKYQIPVEDLHSLISSTTDKDFDNLID